ncbi:hypothetical protein RF11_07010 [Thelohanellus kitauei]|uniref:Uncharacterized protein n=1 Tax=Thelohanellus kitauei TaxID=669202 RepID=A0A0C2J8Q1_THEKT|nr:hypothetical protein RF11_07010 [Thelohanellus kitauei]
MTVSYDSSQNGLTESIEFSVRLHKRARPIVKYWVSLNSTHDERAINLKWAEQGIDLQVDISSSATPGSKLLPNLNFGNYLEFDPVYDVPKEKFNCACVHQDGIPSVLTLTSHRYRFPYPQPLVLMTFEVFNQVPGDLPYAKQIQMDGWRSSCAGKHASKSPPATRLVVLDSMNKFKLRVGMRNVIGLHDTIWEIFEFSDFEQVNVPQQRAFDISNLVAVGYSRLNLSEIHKKNVIVLVDFSRQSVDCNMEAARLIFNAVVFNGQVVTKESYELPRLSKKTHFVRTMPLTSQELKRCLITESPPTRTETPADPANSAMRY